MIGVKWFATTYALRSERTCLAPTSVVMRRRIRDDHAAVSRRGEPTDKADFDDGENYLKLHGAKVGSRV